MKKLLLFILFSVALVGCNDKLLSKKAEGMFGFKDRDYICYNVYKRTVSVPSTGYTYIFRKNGDFYKLSYERKWADSDERLMSNDSFFNPQKLEIKNDSVLIENFTYHVKNKSESELIFYGNHDTLWLKAVKDTFEIKVFSISNDYDVIINPENGDTIKLKGWSY